jgi:hypothetical protein
MRELEKLIEDQNKKLQINIRKITEADLSNPAHSFAQRAKIHYVFRYGNRINWFINEIEQLVKGVSPKFENEFEAAKRMNVGTITGKYAQKALALKNLTVEEFGIIKNEFKEIYLKTKF